jgi:hypothetical protein
MDLVTHEMGERTGTEGLAILTSPGDRWGWQCADLSQLVLPFPEPLPAFVPPQPPDMQAIGQKAQADGAKAYGLITLVMWLGAVPFGVLASASLIAVDVLPTVGDITGWAGLFFIVAWILFWRLGRGRNDGPAAAQRAVAKAQAAYEEEYQEAVRVHAADMSSWQARYDDFAARQAAQLSTLPVWGGASLRTSPRRVDVFGDASGWQGLLATLGLSVLASESALIVLDFSDHQAARPLYSASRYVPGIARQVFMLPEQIQQCDLLRGMDRDDIRDVLVEAFHSDLEGSTREQRALADRAFDEVFEVLGKDLTMARIWRGLRAVTGQEEMPTEPGGLSVDEWDRLTRTFGEEYRIRVGEQLMIIENQLFALRKLGMGEDRVSPDAADLTCFALGAAATSVTAELLANLLVQRCSRLIRRRTPSDRKLTVMVAGADALTERMLARLDSAAESDRARVVLLFRNLDESRLDRMGSGGAVGFFRLTSEAQAARAATWIGLEHRFKVSQLTTSRGTSTGWGSSNTYNESSSVSWNDMHGDAYLGLSPNQGGDGLNVTRGTSTGTNQSGGTSDQYSQSEQRVEEHVVAPANLRKLADGCLLLVEFGDQVRGRRVLATDVSPELAWRPRTIAGPLPIELARSAEIGT